MSYDVRRVNSDFPQCECVFDDDGGDFALMPWEEYERLRAELARFEYNYRGWLDLADSLNCELVEAKEEIERLRARLDSQERDTTFWKEKFRRYCLKEYDLEVSGDELYVGQEEPKEVELAEIREATTCTIAESLPTYVRNLERYRDRLERELAEAKEKLMRLDRRRR